MMDIYETIKSLNLSKLFFIACFIIIVFVGLLINYAENILPQFILQLFKFGKLSPKTKLNAVISSIEVPKRWFIHYYIVGSVVASVGVIEMWRVYRYGYSLSQYFDYTLDVLTTSTRTPTVSGTSAVLAMCLFTINIYRRLYENLCVSVFSSSHMNIIHYLVGNIHYIGCVMLLLAESPGFNDSQGSKIQLSGFKLHHSVGITMCVCCFVSQHHTLSILAALRRNKGAKGKERHLLPVGGLFKWLSCPHMFAEIGIYIGMLIILGGTHTGWTIITVWVITNQVHVAVANHKWYRDTFKDYPKQRKAIIPFLL